MSALYLACAHMRFYWGRSLVVILVAALVIAVPFSARSLLSANSDKLATRAATTPMLLGSKGSRLDLTMSALYFAQERPAPLRMGHITDLEQIGLARAIPLHTAFSSHGFAIVGTTLDYLDLRRLEVAEGRPMAILGEVVLGATVARTLGLGVGDRVISSQENLFDLGGVYPLAMSVVGVLAPSQSADDDAIFTDIKTAWVIQGIGHGHDDVLPDPDTAQNGNGPRGIAPATPRQITPDTIADYHFHGDADDYPVTAAIVVPQDARGATILRGRYRDTESPVQLVQPGVVVGELTERLFRTQTVLDVVMSLVGSAAFIAIGLAIFLGQRLRASEFATATRLGAQPGLILRLVATENLLLLSIASALASGVVLIVQNRADTWVGWLLGFGA